MRARPQHNRKRHNTQTELRGCCVASQVPPSLALSVFLFRSRLRAPAGAKRFGALVRAIERTARCAAVAARPPPARSISTAVLFVATVRGRPRKLAMRRTGLSPLLRTSPGSGRAARSDFAPRATRTRGGDASLARGGSAAMSLSMVSAPPLPSMALRASFAVAASGAAGASLAAAVSSGVALGSATPAAVQCCCRAARSAAAAVAVPPALAPALAQAGKVGLVSTRFAD